MLHVLLFIMISLNGIAATDMDLARRKRRTKQTVTNELLNTDD
jgi:hypothetical protein